MKSQVLHTVLCYVSCEASVEIWNWSLLGVIKEICVYSILNSYSNRPLSKRVRSWVGISTAKAVGIVWRETEQAKRQAKIQHCCNSGCPCSQVRSNCTDAAFFFLSSLQYLQTTPSTIAAWFGPSFPLVLVMADTSSVLILVHNLFFLQRKDLCWLCGPSFRSLGMNQSESSFPAIFLILGSCISGYTWVPITFYPAPFCRAFIDLGKRFVAVDGLCQAVWWPILLIRGSATEHVLCVKAFDVCSFPDVTNVDFWKISEN